MIYDIELPPVKTKKRKLPARVERATSHAEACAVLIRASEELRLAIARVDNVQFGSTIRTCNAFWRWELLPPLAITRYLNSGVLK